MKFYFILLSFIVLASCGPRERISKDVFDAVNDHMQAKKLSDSEIIEEALLWGDSISAAAQQELMNNLHEAIESSGFSGAVTFCNAEATSIVAAMSEEYGVKIKRASKQARNPEDLPTEMEASLLEAYAYNAEHDIKNEPNIQSIQNGDVLLYTKAIVIPNGFCLNCHGDVDKDIAPETLSKIDSLYPEDLARGHKVGSLRGMWSVEIPKKAVVNRL